MKTNEKSNLLRKYTSSFHPFYWSLWATPKPIQIEPQGPTSEEQTEPGERGTKTR